MSDIFITNIKIDKVRHLEGVEITLSEGKRKHLILTGKNGSGKTSVLDALAGCLNIFDRSWPLGQNRYDISNAALQRVQRYAHSFYAKQALNEMEGSQQGAENKEVMPEGESASSCLNDGKRIESSGLCIEFNNNIDMLLESYWKGQFVLAYYKAERFFESDVSNHIEKVELKDAYEMKESPRQDFVKYLVDLKFTEALARTKGNIQKAESINEWFVKLENLLQSIFEDKSLTLIFDEDAFTFHIKEDNRELFDFNTLSSGFSAVLDIVLDIMMRMEKATNRSFDYNIPGIVLIDEIETHLHLELQKTVLELLTTLFPNVQFIVSTHSPFVLNSLDNVVIYDLENHTKVDNGLSNIPYEGVVEGYFKADVMSKTLREKYQRYKELVAKEELTDDDFEEIAGLEVYLDEIPDYLALDITTEYQRLKAELGKREDI